LLEFVIAALVSDNFVTVLLEQPTFLLKDDVLSAWLLVVIVDQ
jgi:hypothetical protein